MPGPRILYGYSYYASEAYGDVRKLVEDYLGRMREAGIDVEGFCLTLNPPGPCLTFPDLDSRWRRGETGLMAMYAALERKLEGKDVFLNATGINLHPRFVETLPVYTVFQCFDDPENSANLSRPVAAAYDLCLVGNIAEVEAYRGWGAKRAEWTPLGFTPDVYDPGLTERQVLEEPRDIDLFMMIDRLSPWRQARMDALGAAFPDAHFYGRGWPRGYLPPDRQVAFLRRSRIGPNIHNSTGPINYRTFYLPANGVLQICDNKSHLGKIFELGKEVVGFDSVKECIELCRYYLAHEEERRAIAVSGFRRAVRDYNETAIFKRNLALIETGLSQRVSERPAPARSVALDQTERTRLRRKLYPIIRVLSFPGRALGKVRRKLGFAIAKRRARAG